MTHVNVTALTYYCGSQCQRRN